MSPRQVTSETDRLLTIPNLITVFRILLIVPFVQAVMNGNDVRATGIFFIAGMSDTIDGTLARVLHQQSRIGRLVDPVADKVLNGIAYVAMSLFRGSWPAIPVWAMAMVIVRDVLILVGCAVIYARIHRMDFRPTVAGKLNTFLELIGIGLFLGISIVPALSVLFPWLFWLLGASIVISFAGYARQGVAMLKTD